MKKSLLSLLLILGLYPVNAQLPSNCNVPLVLRKYYEGDVKDMALKRLYSIKSPDTGLIDIPQWCQDTVWHGLAAIFNRHDQPQVDSVFNKYCVHTDIDIAGVSVIFREICVDVDTNYSWTSNWLDLNTKTGIPSLDTLLAKYGFAVTYVYHWTNDPPTVILTTTQYINTLPFCDSLESFQGIIRAYPNYLSSTGPKSSIAFSDTANIKYYTFPFHWGGDVGYHHDWRFRVNPDCSIEFLGNEPGCPGSGWWWHPSLPEPSNCNILDIPQPLIPCQELEVHPNPSSGLITISITENFSRHSLTILSLNGQELLKQTITEPTTTIDVSTLPGGIYFVKVTGEGTVQVGKFIKD